MPKLLLVVFLNHAQEPAAQEVHAPDDGAKPCITVKGGYSDPAGSGHYQWHLDIRNSCRHAVVLQASYGTDSLDHRVSRTVEPGSTERMPLEHGDGSSRLEARYTWRYKRD